VEEYTMALFFMCLKANVTRRQTREHVTETKKILVRKFVSAISARLYRNRYNIVIPSTFVLTKKRTCDRERGRIERDAQGRMYPKGFACRDLFKYSFDVSNTSAILHPRTQIYASVRSIAWFIWLMRGDTVLQPTCAFQQARPLFGRPFYWQ